MTFDGKDNGSIAFDISGSYLKIWRRATHLVKVLSVKVLRKGAIENSTSDASCNVTNPPIFMSDDVSLSLSARDTEATKDRRVKLQLLRYRQTDIYKIIIIVRSM